MTPGCRTWLSNSLKSGPEGVMVRKDLGTRSVIRMSNSFQPPLPLPAPSMNSACAIRARGGGHTCMGQL